MWEANNLVWKPFFSISTLNPRRLLNEFPHLLSGPQVFSTFFQHPKYSWTSKERKKKEKLGEERRKSPKRNPETPNWSQLKQSQGFSDSDYLGAGWAGEQQCLPERWHRARSWAGCWDPVPWKPGSCVVLGHPGAPPEWGICAAILLWPGLV